MTRPIHLARRIMEINAEYERRLALGFPVVLGGSDETLQVARDVDWRNWLVFLGICDEAVLAGVGDQPAGMPIRTTLNHNYVVTYDEGAQIVRGLRTWGALAQANWWALKDAARAATTAEALNAVDITQGWP